MKKFIVTSSVLGMFAVIIGAFGAHSLKASLTDYEMRVFSTGSSYHFYHTLALMAYAIYGTNNKRPSWPAWSFIMGIILFSGSLYGVAVLHAPKLGMITPFGGLGLIIGWFGFAKVAYKDLKSSKE